MNIVVIKEKIKEGLDSVSCSLGADSQLPILKNVFLEASKNKICFVSTNLETAITYFVLGKVIEEGKTTIPFVLFSGLVGAMQSERINIGLKNNLLEIKSDNYRAKIKGIPAEEFPIIPKLKNKKNFIEMDAAVLKEALNQVLVATRFSDIRPELNSIFFSFKPDLLVLAATDSFRLAEKKITDKQFKSTFENNFSCLLPVKTAQEILQILKEQGWVKIFKDENQILFETEQWECISRLAEGNFPDYKQIIPKNFSGEAVLDRAEFMSAIKLTGVLSSRVNEVSLRPRETEKSLEIFSAEETAGENEYLLPAKFGGKPKQISFNWKYLNDGLRALESEEVYLGLNEERAAMIKSPSDPSYFYILMPILKE